MKVAVHEIVPLEPHSTGNLRQAWQLTPRWLRVVLPALIVVVLLILKFVKL